MPTIVPREARAVRVVLPIKDSTSVGFEHT